MKKAMTLTYETGGNLYLNVTNQCPCACVFCIRKNDDGAYGSDPLWLEHEPSMQEMQEAMTEQQQISAEEFASSTDDMTDQLMDAMEYQHIIHKHSHKEQVQYFN